MRGHERIVLRLEVDRDADPITGTLSEDEQGQQSFTGWLGLTEAIEQIRGAHGHASPLADEGPDGTV